MNITTATILGKLLHCTTTVTGLSVHHSLDKGLGIYNTKTMSESEDLHHLYTRAIKHPSEEWILLQYPKGL